MAMVTTTVSPGARPSMPSVRLTALLVPATIMMAKNNEGDLGKQNHRLRQVARSGDPRPEKGEIQYQRGWLLDVSLEAHQCGRSAFKMPVEKNPHQDRQAHLEEELLPHP